jgi:hypothetical protein
MEFSVGIFSTVETRGSCFACSSWFKRGRLIAAIIECAVLHGIRRRVTTQRLIHGLWHAASTGMAGSNTVTFPLFGNDAKQWPAAPAKVGYFANLVAWPVQIMLFQQR